MRGRGAMKTGKRMVAPMKKLCLLALGLAPVLRVSAQSQTITSWVFENLGTTAAPYNTPAATFGAGTATQLGMNNSYTFNNGEGPGSAANCDVLATAGASTGSGAYAWRVRGNGNSANTGPGVANGWNSAAPIATQGAMFTANTTLFNNLTLSVDINATGQGERNLAILFTLDDTAATPTWQNATITSAGSQGTLFNNSSSSLTISGNYVQLSGAGTGWNNRITASFPGVSQDPNFAVEIVNASTGADNVSTAGTALNNSSGNWRYDDVIISGVSVVPEPSSIALAGLGGLALLGRRRPARSRA